MNSNIMALQPEKFIFVKDNSAKTTSFNIAETFGKLHKHVLRDIEKVIERIKDIDSAPKFGLCFQNNELQNGKPIPFYEMDKDGFILVVMGYTGEKAMSIKVSYINAFNFILNKLLHQPTTSEPPTKLACVGGLLLEDQDLIKATVKQRAESLPREKWASASIKMWSTIKAKYGCSYKEVPADQTAAILSLLSRLDFDDEVLEIPKKELEMMIQERVKALPPPAPENTLTIPLYNHDAVTTMIIQFKSDRIDSGRWMVYQNDGNLMIQPIPTDHLSMTFDKFCQYASQERGLLVINKNELINKLLS